MELINILIMLAIMYLVILIIDKLAPLIIGGLLALIIVLIVPYIFKAIIWVFSGFMNVMSMPIYWVTGYKLVLPWWIGLIMVAIGIIPMLGFWGVRRGEPTF
ncbi:hypothetical protein LCGC14_0694120 [marine sediment metagenome]|uniref:Uncharacterized protein n=1 Tax=marine sediment metagenome TaxID=412755 RepID=A0A0F9QJQ4_9ZZZZ